MSAEVLSAPAKAATLDFAALLERVHAIGRDVLAVHASEVDRDSRFPVEAFDALKAEKLLSCYVPPELGGIGLDIVQVSRLCEALGRYCASSAMVWARSRCTSSSSSAVDRAATSTCRRGSTSSGWGA